MAMSPVRDLNFNFGVTYADQIRQQSGRLEQRRAPLSISTLRLLPGSCSRTRRMGGDEFGGSGRRRWADRCAALLYVDARLADRYNTSSDLFPQKRQQSFVVVNGRIGISGNDQLWALRLLGAERDQGQLHAGRLQLALPGSEHHADAGLSGGSAKYFSAYLAEPRTYGITLRSRF